MAQYKTVPGPTVLVAKKSDTPQKAMAPFASIIEKECQGGWDYYAMEPLAFLVKKGIIGRLIASFTGASPYSSSITYYMLIFKKD